MPLLNRKWKQSIEYAGKSKMKTPIFYQTSPYIVVQQNGRNHNIYSVMDDTEVPISIQEIKLLSRFKDPQVLTRVQPEFERQIVYRTGTTLSVF